VATRVTDYVPDSSPTARHGAVVLSLAHCCGLAGPAAHDISAEFEHRFERAGSTEESMAVLLSVVARCGDARHPFAYLSVPLTTGRPYIELRTKHATQGSAESEEFHAERLRVVAANRTRAHQAAKRLRANIRGMLIDPSRMVDVPGWEQPDYHGFWTSVIGRFAEEVFFLDGWQYSVGCTIEFSTAVRLGLPTLTTDFATLNAATGSQLVREAVREYAESGLDPSQLSDALAISKAD
jgi:hypothetical protein